MYLRGMKKGEKLVIYHSDEGKAAVGTAKVVSVDATDPKNPQVRIKPASASSRRRPSRPSAPPPSSRTPSSSASSASPSCHSPPRSTTCSSL